MEKRKINRKAVSPVIATLLMIAIAVAASVVMYSWMNTMVKNQSTQSQTAIRLEEVQFSVKEANTTAGYVRDAGQFIKISIRNTGTVGAVIQTVYVYQQDTQLYKFDGLSIAFSAGELKAVGCTNVTMATTDDWEDAVTGADLGEIDVIKDGLSMTIPLETATAYRIKMVTDIGFSVESTYYTPNQWG